MRKGSQEKCTCEPKGGAGRCQVETTLTIDSRGQMVLPKSLRERAGIKGGDRLALVSWEKNGEIESISILKVEALSKLIEQSQWGGKLS